MGNVTFHPDQKQLNGSMKSDWGKIEKKRQEVFAKAYIELYGALCAYVLAVQKKDVDGLREALSSGERLFSGYYAEVQRFMQMHSGEISSKELEDLVSMVISRGESLQEVLDPNYDFQVVADFKESIEPVYKLCDVILSIWGFLHFPFLQKHFSGMGPGLDLAREKVLYACGKMVARLEQAGRDGSDKQSERGARVSRKHIGHQAVYEAFHHVDWEGLKMIRIGELIETYLLGLEDKKPKSRRWKVYCGDYIAKTILPQDEKIKEILLREGILKK